MDPFIYTRMKQDETGEVLITFVGSETTAMSNYFLRCRTKIEMKLN